MARFTLTFQKTVCHKITMEVDAVGIVEANEKGLCMLRDRKVEEHDKWVVCDEFGELVGIKKKGR